MVKIGSQKEEKVPHDQKHPQDLGGEGSVGGHAPDPESDDDILDQAHQMGIYDQSSDEGEGGQEEVGIAEQIEKNTQR